MKIAKIIFILCVALLSHNIMHAQIFGKTETLQYRVMYKWGLVQKQAGTATFHLTSQGNNYTSVVTAKSAPWADHIYSVRDTLSSTFDIKNIIPSRYERIAHEGGRYSHDIVNFSKRDGTTYATCYRERRGKNDSQSTITHPELNALGDAIDMLSSFYYIRAFVGSELKEGKTHVVNIFSTKRKEILTLTNLGTCQLKIDGVLYTAIKISFTFTSDGKKNTSKPITAWLSAQPGHIPLKLEGELPIGKIQCIYMAK